MFFRFLLQQTSLSQSQSDHKINVRPILLTDLVQLIKVRTIEYDTDIHSKSDTLEHALFILCYWSIDTKFLFKTDKPEPILLTKTAPSGN